MARKFDLSMAIVAGLVIFVVLTGSGCLDENPVDTASDATLEDITDGEMTDASGTMESTLFKMAEEASGGYEPVAVAEKVKIEVLDDGSIAPYDIDNLPKNLPADVALDAFTHPKDYFTILELPNGNLKIIGYQELNGWKIDTSPKIGQYGDIKNYGQVVESGYNDNIFGNNEGGKTRTAEVYDHIFEGNPCGNEISAVLSEGDNGDTILTVLYGPGWADETLIVNSADPRGMVKDGRGPWAKASTGVAMDDDGSICVLDDEYSWGTPGSYRNSIEVNGQKITVSSVNLRDLVEKRTPSYNPDTGPKHNAYVITPRPTTEGKLYPKSKMPALVVSKTS